jgi:uncharacterized membrane protein YhaH (DUF805 family)
LATLVALSKGWPGTLAIGSLLAVFIALVVGSSRALAVLAVGTSAGQALVAVYGNIPSALILDDVAVLCLVALLVPRLVSSEQGRRCVLAFSLFAAALLLAYVRGRPGGDLLADLRRFLIPALLILGGTVLSSREAAALRRALYVLGAVAAFYAVYEVAVGLPVNPAALVGTNSGSNARLVRGLPANYWYYGLSEEPIRRAGTYFLNPTTGGVFVATATVAFWHSRNPTALKWLYLAVGGFAVSMTFSRGALLLLAAGVLLPTLMKRFGPRAALLLGGVVAASAAQDLAAHGNSSRHLEGFVSGLETAVEYPFGRGFGYFGNLAVQSGVATAGESLLGSLFAATGLFGIGMIALVAAQLVRRLRSSGTGAWLPALALGALVAAAFSETVAGLTGSVALWLFVGAAVAGTGAVSRQGRLASDQSVDAKSQPAHTNESGGEE